jgi:hypothetical protein
LGTTLKEEGDAIFVSADGSIFVGGIVGTNIIGKVEPNTFQGFITKLGFESIATYSLKASSTTINEGSTATFTLTTTNVSAGTLVPYILSGISAADVFGGSLSGNASTNSIGVATISVTLLNDALTEGTETLVVTAGGVTASTVVNDTSKTTQLPDLNVNSNLDMFDVNVGGTPTVDKSYYVTLQAVNESISSSGASSSLTSYCLL